MIKTVLRVSAAFWCHLLTCCFCPAVCVVDSHTNGQPLYCVFNDHRGFLKWESFCFSLLLSLLKYLGLHLSLLCSVTPAFLMIRCQNHKIQFISAQQYFNISKPFILIPNLNSNIFNNVPGKRVPLTIYSISSLRLSFILKKNWYCNCKGVK